MEILFCDICNESVPIGDLETGHAFRRGGRVVCSACDRAMSAEGHEALTAGAAAAGTGAAAQVAQTHASTPSADSAVPAAPATPAPVVVTRGSGAGGVVVGLLALAFAAGGFALLIEKLDAANEENESFGRALRRDIDVVRQDQGRVAVQVNDRLNETAEAMRAEQAAAGDEVLAALDGLRQELEASRAEFGEITGQVAALRDEIGRADGRVQTEIANVGQQVIDLERDMRFYSERMVELEETLRGMATRGPLNMPPGGGAGEGGAPSVPAWQGLVTDLQHANAGIRLDAVYALGETKDERVVEFLVPALKDDDLFVRMATARVLMDLDARSAVPNLIDALEDTSSAVREAAMVALRKVTGKDHKFDPLASDGERAKRVKAWRDWWKKSGEEFLGAPA